MRLRLRSLRSLDISTLETSNLRGVNVTSSKAVLNLVLALVATFAVASESNAANGNRRSTNKAAATADTTNAIEELNPFAPDIEEQLEKLDQQYREATNKSPWLDGIAPLARRSSGNCYRSSCAVYAYVRRSDQKMYLYVNGNPYAEYLVSTGAPGHDTPNFDRHPNGRVYDKYSSSTFPGGNYAGLGNMPYAVFIQGGFAVHGTPKGNWKNLGRKASHGCVRVHPDNAFTFNRLVRQYGVDNVWITIGD